jgi:hypothetical protein
VKGLPLVLGVLLMGGLLGAPLGAASQATGTIPIVVAACFGERGVIAAREGRWATHRAALPGLSMRDAASRREPG